jgi:hypothetical protein
MVKRIKRLSAKKNSWLDYCCALDSLQPFSNSNGSLRGGDTYSGRYGRLPQEWVERFKSAETNYVVYSYQTPIAWHERDGWVMPPVSYGMTTTGHQGTILTALRAVDKWAPDFRVPEHMGKFE